MPTWEEIRKVLKLLGEMVGALVLALLTLALLIACLVMFARKACAAPACPHPHRSRAPIELFKKEHPCPAKCRTYTWDEPVKKFRLYQMCGACQVDHICPLACCGADDVNNLQWLTSKENRAKSANCSACTKLDWHAVDDAIQDAVKKTNSQPRPR